MNFAALILGGFLLGLKHAFETDHIAAVVNIRSRLAGLWWGIGHTLVLLIAGVSVLILKVNIPAGLTSGFEIAAAAVLIILGTAMIYRRNHSSQLVERTSTLDQRGALKSFAVGVLHGFAGSGAFVVLLTGLVGNLKDGIYFISVFGAGSILGMIAVSSVLHASLTYTSRFAKLDSVLRVFAGGLSIAIGIITIMK